MPSSAPKKRHQYVWNGSGMTTLSPERRSQIGKELSKKYKAQWTGWPPHHEDVDDPAAVHREWARRFENHRLRKLNENG